MFHLGLGKTLFNSSACLLDTSAARFDAELVLTERLLRKKASGAWPEGAIRLLENRIGAAPLKIAENRDVMNPLHREVLLNQAFPFFEHLEMEGLGRYTRRFNAQIEFVTHHLCHASAAAAMSPFEKCLIVVMDGAGSKRSDFTANESEDSEEPHDPDAHEECSVYLHDAGKLTCVRKRWRTFRKGRQRGDLHFSEGAGIFYENAAEYIFHSGQAAGKVMGLAPLGKAATKVGSRVDYLESLDWARAFTGRGKQSWESSGHLELYSRIAAEVQEDFEAGFFALLGELRIRFPDYAKLILTGGCALNCTANGKLLGAGIFDEVYVPPFPGDESIGFGAAHFLRRAQSGAQWTPVPHELQHGYFGPRDSAPTDAAAREIFRDYDCVRPSSIAEYAADLLRDGHVIGWFQGRSESGPRALGNRSILARPDLRGMKDRLNREIKFREDFRPYGCSVPHERAREYFDVSADFNAPYMSFAVRTRAQYRQRLAEVTHVDGTSRIQTVRTGQNPLFHRLLLEFGKRTDLFCLLNTSLNVMGEPIVESLGDAEKFLRQTPVHGIAVGDLYFRRPA